MATLGEDPDDDDATRAQHLFDLASSLLAEDKHVPSWNAARAAVELEASLDPGLWLDRLASRMALLRGLFAALIAGGKLAQASATIPLVRGLREKQAALLSQDDLVSEIEYLIRDARLLHHKMQDIQAWPLLQEAAAMRPALQPPNLDRVTMSLAGELVDSAVVFHCSSRSTLATEASEMAGTLYRELAGRGSGFYASQLRGMIDDLPEPLQRAALAPEQCEASPRELDQRDAGDPAAADAGDRKPRILIVDDSALMLDLAREALEGAGYQVDVAQVLSQISDEDKLRSLDLILMDVMMPELHGDDVAAILRGEIDGVTAPIYLLSSLDDDELAQRAEEAGIEGYISKRDGLEVMVERVREILKDPR